MQHGQNFHSLNTELRRSLFCTSNRLLGRWAVQRLQPTTWYNLVFVVLRAMPDTVDTVLKLDSFRCPRSPRHLVGVHIGHCTEHDIQVHGNDRLICLLDYIPESRVQTLFSCLIINKLISNNLLSQFTPTKLVKHNLMRSRRTEVARLFVWIRNTLGPCYSEAC